MNGRHLKWQDSISVLIGVERKVKLLGRTVTLLYHESDPVAFGSMLFVQGGVDSVGLTLAVFADPAL